MDGGCYIPNNPAHYGLPEPGPGPGGTTAPMAIPASTYTSQLWATADDMASFSLPPLDLDPLFPFSPTTNYKTDYPLIKDRSCLGVAGGGVGHVAPGGDMADVLLSLKHPIVHPGQISPSSFACSGSPQCSASGLSYTVHPQMLSMSPSGGCGGYGGGYCSGGVDQFTAGIPGGGGSQHNVNMFPSMSVNVSMNMTMHGYTTPLAPDNLHTQMTCPQVQWNSNGTAPSPVYCQTQGLLSPQPYNNSASATYSFTADFRPQGVSGMSNLSGMPGLGNTGLGVMPDPVYKSAGKPTGRRHSVNITASASACFHASSTSSLKLSPNSDEDSQTPNLCRICGKTYARPSTLKTHLRTHSGEKPYRCDECNKSFSQAANLTAHVRTHSGEKPFRCPICDRRFSQSSSVTTHMRTHSGERPYRCRLCKKAFSDSSTLTKHLRIHSGEKPYQCKLCLLRFSQSGNLNRHMRVHGGAVTA